MLKDAITHNIQDIEFKVLYSSRRTLGISVHHDSSIVVRVPYLTSLKTINRLVQEKAGWIIKHRDSYKGKVSGKPDRLYANGEMHLFRGTESALKIEKNNKSYIRFYDSTIDLGLDKNDDAGSIKRLLYQGYKNEALIVFPEMMRNVLSKYENQAFKPSGLIIRTMKRRWGSCSNKGIITLSTELIKLPDLYIEYVIVHELCHLKHHNHGAGYYNLLSELFPEWKLIRKELRRYVP
ncbi:MAG: SprT family zinc-dependent metalloprotease [Bacteroidota bacterium]